MSTESKREPIRANVEGKKNAHELSGTCGVFMKPKQTTKSILFYHGADVEGGKIDEAIPPTKVADALSGCGPR